MKIGKTLKNIVLATAGTLLFAFHSQNAFSQYNMQKYEDSLALWKEGQNNLTKGINQLKEISRQYNEPSRPNENYPGENDYLVFKDFMGRADLHPHKNHTQVLDEEFDYKKFAVNGIEPVQVYYLDMLDFISDKRTHSYFPIYKKPTNFLPHTKGELIKSAPGLPNIYIVSIKQENGNYKPTYYQNSDGERIPYGSTLSTCGGKEHYVKTEFSRDWQYGLENKNDLLILNEH